MVSRLTFCSPCSAVHRCFVPQIGQDQKEIQYRYSQDDREAIYVRQASKQKLLAPDIMGDPAGNWGHRKWDVVSLNCFGRLNSNPLGSLCVLMVQDGARWCKSRRFLFLWAGSPSSLPVRVSLAGHKKRRSRKRKKQVASHFPKPSLGLGSGFETRTPEAVLCWASSLYVPPRTA